ncbi:MAG TPA: hypothetical protein P5298_08900, partial [Spirochaetia bacterium]|nr:hypothetical protein [Spirochaetia bacterium]
ELVEETDLADVIGYIDSGSSSGEDGAAGRESDAMIESGEPDAARSPDRVEPEDETPIPALVFASPIEEMAESVIGLDDGTVTPADEEPVGEEPIDEEQVGVADAGDAAIAEEDAAQEPMVEASDAEDMAELLEEVEFDLFLSTLDLSALEGYRDEDGFLELDDGSFEQQVYQRIAPAESQDEELGDEITMLTDEQRERIEELQAPELEDDEAADLEPLVGSTYRQIISAISYHRVEWPGAAVEELPAVADGEALDVVPLEPEAADAAEAPGDAIVMVDGVYTLNRDAVSGAVPEDKSLKALAESVLAHRGA